MKELLILSGKGGTGKTTIASSFIKIEEAKAFADCDIDAPNLHLVSKKGENVKKKEYLGMQKAFIDEKLCISCGACHSECRFDAIEKTGNAYSVSRYDCEGCGLCEAICPEGAIAMKDAVAGDMMLYKDDKSVFSTAKLRMGSGNSGKLVTEVKNDMKANAFEDTPIAIIDGSPGIGCPVIASMSGVDMVLIVAEPSVSGLSDMKRILNTAAYFKILTAVCVNKYNINHMIAKEIEEFCLENNIFFAGKIAFEPLVEKAINEGTDILETPVGESIKELYNNVKEKLY